MIEYDRWYTKLAQTYFSQKDIIVFFCWFVLSNVGSVVYLVPHPDDEVPIMRDAGCLVRSPGILRRRMPQRLRALGWYWKQQRVVPSWSSWFIFVVHKFPFQGVNMVNPPMFVGRSILSGSLF